MKTICAWCGCLIKGGPVASPADVSHGICLTCAAAKRRQLFSVRLPAPRLFTVEYEFAYADGGKGRGHTPVEAVSRKDALERFTNLHPHILTARVLPE